MKNQTLCPKTNMTGVNIKGTMKKIKIIIKKHSQLLRIIKHSKLITILIIRYSELIVREGVASGGVYLRGVRKRREAMQ